VEGQEREGDGGKGERGIGEGRRGDFCLFFAFDTVCDILSITLSAASRFLYDCVIIIAFNVPRMVLCDFLSLKSMHVLLVSLCHPII
jgi:hypothetical protein